MSPICGSDGSQLRDVYVRRLCALVSAVLGLAMASYGTAFIVQNGYGHFFPQAVAMTVAGGVTVLIALAILCHSYKKPVDAPPPYSG